MVPTGHKKFGDRCSNSSICNFWTYHRLFSCICYSRNDYPLGSLNSTGAAKFWCLTKNCSLKPGPGAKRKHWGMTSFVGCAARGNAIIKISRTFLKFTKCYTAVMYFAPWRNILKCLICFSWMYRNEFHLCLRWTLPSGQLLPVQLGNEVSGLPCRASLSKYAGHSNLGICCLPPLQEEVLSENMMVFDNNWKMQSQNLRTMLLEMEPPLLTPLLATSAQIICDVIILQKSTGSRGPCVIRQCKSYYCLCRRDGEEAWQIHPSYKI